MEGSGTAGERPKKGCGDAERHSRVGFGLPRVEPGAGSDPRVSPREGHVFPRAVIHLNLCLAAGGKGTDSSPRRVNRALLRHTGSEPPAFRDNQTRRGHDGAWGAGLHPWMWLCARGTPDARLWGRSDPQCHLLAKGPPPSLPPSPHESPECPQEVLKAAQNIPRAPSCQWVPKRFPPLLLKPSPFSPPRSSQWKPTPTPSAFRGSSVLPRPQFHPTEPGAAASNWKLGKFNTDTGRFLLYTAKINPWRSPGGGRWGVGGSREKAVSLPGFNKHSKDIYRAKGQIQSTSKDRCPPTSGLGYNLFLFL